MRIGLDNIYGYVSAPQDWTKTGGNLEKAKVLSLQETKELLNNNNVQLIDLRGAAEYNAGHIANAENVFVGTLIDNLEKINKHKNVIIYCQSGDRSSIGYSLLSKYGFSNVSNFSGSIQEWVNAGEPVIS